MGDICVLLGEFQWKSVSPSGKSTTFAEGLRDIMRTLVWYLAEASGVTVDGEDNCTVLYHQIQCSHRIFLKRSHNS